MVEMLYTTRPGNLSKHLRNVFSSQKLAERATTKDFLIVRSEGERRIRRRIRHYDLDSIISVDYRVYSQQAIQSNRGLCVGKPQDDTA